MQTKIWMMTAVLLGGSTMMRAQANNTVKDDLFAGTEKFAANASSVTEVDMDPDSLDLVNGSNSSRARRTVLSVVHTYEYDRPGMYNLADVDAYRNKLNTGDWHCSVHVRELKSGESTDVCRKHRTDNLEESAVITVEPKSLTFIHTIRRPATPAAKPGGDSQLVSPFSAGFPIEEGMPLSAMAAEMKANAAEMHAQAAVNRAEMATLRPEMAAAMAAMRAGMAGAMPDLNVLASDDGGRVWLREPLLSDTQRRKLQDQALSIRIHPPAITLSPELEQQWKDLGKIRKAAPAPPQAPEPFVLRPE